MRAIRVNTCNFPAFSGCEFFVRFPTMLVADGLRVRFDDRLAGRGQPSTTATRRGSSITDEGVEETAMATGRTSIKASCENCFFHKNLLCAVSETGPCATFRPARPEGLRPPSQMRFVFRQERRLQVAWAFPSANEQVGLHA
ncbi:MAG: hypothetical protein ACM3UX_01670 [Candidatus Woesearchaeota archaeon]